MWCVGDVVVGLCGEDDDEDDAGDVGEGVAKRRRRGRGRRYGGLLVGGV